jgi:hypothetical protein
MPADDRSKIPLERHAHAIAAMDSNEAATIGVSEVNLCMPTGLIDPIYPEAGRAQRGDGVSKRRAHQPLPPNKLS